jgi:ADP-heptose:LPS heptosyltransferase
MDLPGAGLLLHWAARRSARSGVPTLQGFDAAQARRVLCALTTGLGDMILSTPVLDNLRAALPRARIALFARAAWQPLFASDPRVDEFIPYHGKYRRFLTTRRALADFAPDLTLALHVNDPDVLPLLRLAGCERILRIPVRGTRFGFLLANRERPGDQDSLPGLHYVDNRLRLFDSLSLPAPCRAPAVHLPPGAHAALRAAPGTPLSGPYWVYHAHAAGHYKDWPPRLAREFLQRALAAFPAHVIALTGADKDHDRLLALAGGLPQARVLNLAGRLDLAQTAALLAGAQAVVAPDTGILHLAAALDVPTVGLFAATDSMLIGQRAPSALQFQIQKGLTCDPCQHKRCPHFPALCMAQISVDEVLAALRQLLREARA